jgi:sporulation integral membrane protein YtvI
MPGQKGIWLKIGLAAGIFWLGSKYFLPLLLPFLAGGLIALAAEPAVSCLHRRLKLPRLLAAGVGVSVAILLAVALVWALGAVLLRQVTRLANSLPDLETTARQGVTVLSDWLVNLTHQAPAGVQPMLTDTVLRFFNDTNAMVEQVTRRVPGAVATALGKVPDSALGAGTALLSAFMISARWLKLKEYFRQKTKELGLTKYWPGVKKARQAALGWLKAQGVLMLLTWLTVAVGFWLLGIRGGFLWAVLVALVDAVPMLGTGLILLPWALVSFLQGLRLQAVGLCALVGVAALLRTTLEPRLVGRQLGLDPLVMLVCLYAGYRLWGFLGLLLAPMLAGVLNSVFRPQ